MDPDFVVFMDGGLADGDRIAVSAVVCRPTGELVVERARHVGRGTSNVAEYLALRHAIAMANLVGARRPLFCSDSKIVVQQVNGWWAIKGHLYLYHGQCTGALMGFDRWLLRHVSRDKNRRADWLVSGLLGHRRTLKRAPDVDPVSCDHEGWSGWEQLASVR
jgi:ribonuclease HI